MRLFMQEGWNMPPVKVLKFSNSKEELPVMQKLKGVLKMKNGSVWNWGVGKLPEWVRSLGIASGPVLLYRTDNLWNINLSINQLQDCRSSIQLLLSEATLWAKIFEYFGTTATTECGIRESEQYHLCLERRHLDSPKARFSVVWKCYRTTKYLQKMPKNCRIRFEVCIQEFLPKSSKLQFQCSKTYSTFVFDCGTHWQKKQNQAIEYRGTIKAMI